MTVARHERLRILMILVAAIALAGCQPSHEARAPLAMPTAVVRVEHFAGTALSGPQPVAPASADAWAVSAQLTAITMTVPPGFERVGPAARLVLGPETGTVVTPSARLIYSTLTRPLAADESLAFGDAGQHVSIGTPLAALPPGATASIAIALPDGTPMTADYPRRSIRVELSRRVQLSRRVGGSEAYDVTIVSDDLTNLPTPTPTKPGRATANARRPPAATATSTTTASELIVLPRQQTAGADRFALAIPMTFPNSPATCVVVELTIGGTPSDATLATMRAQLDASSAAVVASRSSAAPSAEDLALVQALDALGAAGASPRGALTFIAGRTGARLSEAVALVADDSLLQLVAGQVQARLGRLPVKDARNVGWLLDRTTIDAISAVSEADAPRVLPPIQGALTIYAGEAGRQLDVLRSIAGESSSSADLYERIVAENTILLEESAPGLRVRAYDWLTSAGRAPAGFDPLGTPQQRRAALEHARDPSTTMPATTTSTTQP